MSSLLVFNRVYRLDIQSVMLEFSTALVNCCPSTFSLTSPTSPPLPKLNVQYILLGAHELWARCTMCKSVFFLKVISCWRTIEAYSGLKSRGLSDSATLPVRRKLLKNDSERMYEAQAVLDKFFDTGHYMKKHDPTLPVKGRFYGWRRCNSEWKLPFSKDDALKSGMTLTNREV